MLKVYIREPQARLQHRLIHVLTTLPTVQALASSTVLMFTNTRAVTHGTTVANTAAGAILVCSLLLILLHTFRFYL